MAKVFVNYRRDDDPSAAARVRDGLEKRFGKSALFMDVDNLLAGQKFDDELAKALSACDVLVSIIGVKWSGILSARTAEAQADPDHRDYVREEIAAALKRGIVVIPVRVGRDGALPALPRPSELPGDIRALVAHQKHDVTHERFGRDVADLANAIVQVRKAQRGTGGGGGARIAGLAAATALALAAVGVGAHVTGVAPWLPTKGPLDDVFEKANRGSPTVTSVAVRESERTKNAESCDGIMISGAKRPSGNYFDQFDKTPTCVTSKSTEREFEDCRDGFCGPQMVFVPVGSFRMGSPGNEEGSAADEGPQRIVTIAKPFAVGKFEVTFAEWDACVAGGGCQSNKTPSDLGWGKGLRPVINVSWEDAKAYVGWLSKTTGQTYRLLTESEWEYAARAGTTTLFSTGPTITTKQANFDGNSTYGGSAKGEYHGKTVEVGSFAPNAFGLHEMHGNVWEWVEDCWIDSYKGAPTDASARTTACTDDKLRVLRGGSWFNVPEVLRSADRIRNSADNRGYKFGFRVARSVLR